MISQRYELRIYETIATYKETTKSLTSASWTQHWSSYNTDPASRPICCRQSLTLLYFEPYIKKISVIHDQ